MLGRCKFGRSMRLPQHLVGSVGRLLSRCLPRSITPTEPGFRSQLPGKLHAVFTYLAGAGRWAAFLARTEQTNRC
jgi:hypothetical protein